jgi:TfoX/Sxy family transcriptional regulator of competence genes
MAYDSKLANRVRRAANGKRAISEKKMFGGVAFLLDGKMFCGVASDDLMVRVGPERHEEARRRPDVRPMDFTGRPMKGYILVGPERCRTQRQVAGWSTKARRSSRRSRPTRGEAAFDSSVERAWRAGRKATPSGCQPGRVTRAARAHHGPI